MSNPKTSGQRFPPAVFSISFKDELNLQPIEHEDRGCAERNGKRNAAEPCGVEHSVDVDDCSDAATGRYPGIFTMGVCTTLPGGTNAGASVPAGPRERVK